MNGGAREPFPPHADGKSFCAAASHNDVGPILGTAQNHSRNEPDRQARACRGQAETRAGTDPRSAAQVGHQRGAEDRSLGIEEILHLILNVSAQCPETDFSKLIMMTLWHCCNEFFASKFTYARTMYERQIKYLFLLVCLYISVRL
jgi:hypothetical protein